MPSTSLEIDGIQITTPAEFLRFLDLTGDRGDLNAFTSRSHDWGLQNSLERQADITRTDAASMFALIIGINEYRSPQLSLRGAVGDALAIKAYLKTNLNIMDSHIQMLCDKDASRQNIIDAFLALRDNDDIQWGDAILIFYAGHGSQLDAPDEWVTRRTQCIVPYDFDANREIHIIPDRTVYGLIEDISQYRGDNITLIIDSCFSGFEVRGENDNMTRTARLDHYSIPANLDNNIRKLLNNAGDSSRTPSTGFQGTRLSPSSHVLLAACGINEWARESCGRGQFTLSLEKALKTTSPDQITYIELLDRLENIVGQNPQLRGNNRHRKVFNSKATEAVQRPYKLSWDSREGYTLHAGAADGVCAGAEFTVYAHYDNTLVGLPLGIMVPKDIKPFRTIMQPISTCDEIEIGVQTKAVQTKVGIQEELRVYIPLKEDLIPVFDSILTQMKEPSSNPNTIALLEDRSAAHLELQREGNQIKFVILDQRVTVYGLMECIYKAAANAQDLRLILQGAAHYYYQLNRSYLNSESTEKHVTIEMFRMECTGVDEMTGRPLKHPCGENLLKNGIVWIEVRSGFEDDLYGIKITNNGKQDLYPYIFFFDNSDLSIGSCYESGGPSQFKVDSPLPANGGTLTMGYGGSQAYQYYIPIGQEVDVGFLKCIFSTFPIDLSHIPQPTPFQPRQSGGYISTSSRGPGSWAKKKFEAEWSCVLIPVVQKRVG